jgi:hypothetical protein
VKFEQLAVILPEDLAGEREGILEVLAELGTARQQMEQVVGRIRELEVQAGRGKVKKLTFRDVGGKAEAVVQGTRYRSAYQENYPQNGETWYCLIGAEDTGLSHTITVHPQFRADAVTSDEDLDELRQVIRETYQGIPDMLLQ